jgi:hypothetical protein
VVGVDSIECGMSVLELGRMEEEHSVAGLQQDSEL